MPALTLHSLNAHCSPICAVEEMALCLLCFCVVLLMMNISSYGSEAALSSWMCFMKVFWRSPSYDVCCSYILRLNSSFCPRSPSKHLNRLLWNWDFSWENRNTFTNDFCHRFIQSYLFLYFLEHYRLKKREPINTRKIQTVSWSFTDVADAISAVEVIPVGKVDEAGTVFSILMTMGPVIRLTRFPHADNHKANSFNKLSFLN